eukprot:3203506-Prymnesium_polylepis.1
MASSLERPRFTSSGLDYFFSHYTGGPPTLSFRPSWAACVGAAHVDAASTSLCPWRRNRAGRRRSPDRLALRPTQHPFPMLARALILGTRGVRTRSVHSCCRAWPVTCNPSHPRWQEWAPKSGACAIVGLRPPRTAAADAVPAGLSRGTGLTTTPSPSTPSS